MLEVVSAGLYSTIQDTGREGYGHLGVPPSGACDPWGYMQANVLAETGPPAAALEMTVVGPEVLVRENCMVALGGSDLGAYVPEELRPLEPGRAHRVRAGTHLTFDPAKQRHGPRGARGYLALAGGIDVPDVLGSASTYVPAGIGGIEGRPIRQGDLLRPRRRGDLRAVGRVWPTHVAPAPYPRAGSPAVLRTVEGPHAHLFGGSTVDWLARTEWMVGGDADRAGVRLTPRSVGEAGSDAASTSEIVSMPVVWGAIQVPPDSDPIVLLADHQTVGGYPVAAVVIRADWPVLGQLLPGQTVSFEAIGHEDARSEYTLQLGALARAAAHPEAGDEWISAADRAEG
jgi:antagonist of KipI